MSISSREDDEFNKNADFRSSRRAARRGRPAPAGRQRQLTVRSELREEPDVRRIARAVIAMALAEAEREAQAEAAKSAEESGDA